MVILPQFFVSFIRSQSEYASEFLAGCTKIDIELLLLLFKCRNNSNGAHDHCLKKLITFKTG